MMCTKLYRDRLKERCFVGPWLQEARNHLDQSFSKMVDHRFLGVQEFLQDLLPLKEVMMGNFCGRKMFAKRKTSNINGSDAAGVEETGKTTKKEEYIDSKLVVEAVGSEEWWCYGEMVLAVGAGPEHLVFASRGCPCHKPKLDKTFFASAHEYMRWRRDALRTHLQKPCPAKGFNAPSFACGRGRTIVNDTYSSVKHFLLLSFRQLSPDAVSRILDDYEKAIQHVKFELFMKIDLFQQLPLLMCSLAAADLDAAVDGLTKATQQYDATKNNPRHIQLTHHVLGDGEDSLRPDVDRFIASKGLDLSRRLARQRRRFKVVKTNELSAESLHRQGALFRNKAHHHDAPFLSFGLSSPEIFKDERFGIAEWAAFASRVQSDFAVIREFGLERHYTYEAWQRQQLALGNPLRSGKHGSHKVVRRIFYKCDILSLFECYPDVERALAKQACQFKKADMQMNTRPLLALKDADETQRSDAVCCRYALRHLKEVAEEDDMMAMPREHTSSLIPLADVLVPNLDASSSESFVSDTLDLAVMCGKASTSFPLQCFRIINSNPKRRKVHISPSTMLRSDMLAIAMYEIEGGEREPRRQTISPSRVDTDVHIISIETLLAMGYDRLKASFVRCKFEGIGSFHFSGMPLPQICHTEIGWTLVSAIVGACAGPCSEVVWTAPPTLTSEEVAILSALVEGGLIRSVTPNTYALTMKGFENLRRSRHVGNFKLLFRRRKAIEVGQMTHWELMDLLFERGWSCKAIVARQKVDAISLSPGVDPVASFYYNSQLEISKSYLHVLCQAKALADIGHTVIQQKQTVEYYNALLRTLTPDVVLPMLVDDSQASELLAIEDAKPEESDEAAQEASLLQQEEGEYDDDDGEPEESAPGQESARQAEPALSSHGDIARRFGPFTFRVQRTKKKTGLELKWIVRCPFHRDDGDLPGTSCTRAAVFHNEEQKEKTRLMLQAWCLAGRFKKTRAEPAQDSHKGVNTFRYCCQVRRGTRC